MPQSEEQVEHVSPPLQELSPHTAAGGAGGGHGGGGLELPLH